MKTLLARKSRNKEVEDTVFTVAKEAAEAVRKDPKGTINATLGVLYDDDGKLVTFQEVWDSYNGLDIRSEVASYSPSFKGDPEYLEEIQKWIFRGIDKKFLTDAVATPGGTGAVGSTIKNYLDPGEEILLPHIGWGPYWIMARENELEVREYKLFKGNRFNIESIEEEARRIMSEQGKVLIVLNDPCHNPTGYSLSHSEWIELNRFLNELALEGPVILLNDIAYMDFAGEKCIEGKSSREYLELFNDNHPNYLVILAFSISKTMTAYGLRAGAQVAISNDSEVIRTFDRANEFTARSMWSNIPKGAMRNLVKIFKSEERMARIVEERRYYVDLLRERADLFIEEAKEVGVPIYPYRDGFFITLKTPNEQREVEIHNNLKKKGIYTIRVNDGIRVAICCLSRERIGGLAARIMEAYNE